MLNSGFDAIYLPPAFGYTLSSALETVLIVAEESHEGLELTLGLLEANSAQ